MGLKTRPVSIDELTSLFYEMFVNNSNKVTKVAPNSILSGIGYGVAKIGQKAIKDIAISESRLFPSNAHGQYLNQIADDFGVAARFGATESSTYVRVVAAVGTTYTAGTHTFSGQGVTFDLETTLTIPVEGFGYAKLRSQGVGSGQRLEAGKISKVSPVPAGHVAVVQEYVATGGEDAEDDIQLRLRIKRGINIAATGTLARIEQVLMLINNRVLRVFFNGYDDNNGHLTLGVVSVNGINFTSPELNSMVIRMNEYLSLHEMALPSYKTPQVQLTNVTHYPIDISFRVNLNAGADADAVRKDIQVAFGKAYDHRNWKQGDRVEWDQLLFIAQQHPQVSYIPDTEFVPNEDITDIPLSQIPRFRGFVMMDLDGNIISNTAATINPIYYPSDPNLFFQTTVLSTID